MSSQTVLPDLDERDRRLIAALQCNARVPVERAAQVLGINARVIRQRLRYLRESGAVAVRGRRVEPEAPHLLRLRVQVTPGGIDAVVDAFASRPDVPHVDVSTSGTEVLATMSAGDTTDPAGLPVADLPAAAGITSIRAQTVLHTFSQPRDWRYPALTDEQRAALEASPPTPAAELDATDRRLLAALLPDARATAESLAAATGLAAATVRRRLSRLGAAGWLHGEVVVDPRALGLTVEAILSLRVDAAHLDDTGRRLAAHPAVHEAVATTGPTNLETTVWVDDLEALYRLLTVDLARPELSVADIVLVARAAKRAGLA